MYIYYSINQLIALHSTVPYKYQVYIYTNSPCIYISQPDPAKLSSTQIGWIFVPSLAQTSW